MQYNQGDPQELRDQFWKAMAASPYLLLQLDADIDTAAPMTALLDKDAHHEIWFLTTRDSRFARMGPATATFASKDHAVFARFHGTLSEETSRERLDKQWGTFAAAWFPGGKDDPNLLMLRMELGDAAIWSGELGMFDAARMALGMDVTTAAKASYVETRI